MLSENKNALYMFRLYGIPEWNEKCAILSKDERLRILKDLRNGIFTPLVALVKLPFPKFASTYFRRYPKAAIYLNDPAFGHKLYILSNANKTTFKNMVQEKVVKVDKRSDLFSDIEESFFLPFDSFIKKISQSKMQYSRFLYITQYIDLETARRIGTSKAQIFEADEENGYQLFEKLALLNTASRLIMVKYLGLYGHTAGSISNVSRELGISEDYIRKIIKILIEYLALPLGEFKVKIGYVDKDYGPKDYKEYTNKAFKNIDLRAEAAFIFKYCLSDKERSVLNSKSPQATIIYIASKYIFKSPIKTSEYLVLDREIVNRSLNIQGL